MAYYTVRYSYTTVRTRLEFSETDLRTVSGYDQFAVNSSQVEFLLTVRTNILVKHHPGQTFTEVIPGINKTFTEDTRYKQCYAFVFILYCKCPSSTLS